LIKLSGQSNACVKEPQDFNDLGRW
jgi:hypothetical protein